MSQTIAKLQRALLALCLIPFLSSCSTPCRQWEMREIITCYPCFNSGKLFLAPETDYSHMELEISRTHSGIRMYINILFLLAFPCPEDPTRTKVDISFEDDQWTVYAHLLQGGQRLLLPGETAEALIQALLDNRSFTIRLGRNESTIVPDRFCELYTKLLELPLEEEPPLEAPR